MPARLNAPVLTLDAGKMHEINPRNVEALFGMWTVFSQCSQSIKDGKRLENMSWRLWARETLCCPAQPDKTIVPDIETPLRPSQVPSLSNSIASDDESSDDETSRQQSRQKTHSSEDDDSALSKSRGNEPHLTATTLKKIVATIQEKVDLGPLSPSIEASLPLLKHIDQDMSTRKMTQENEEDYCGRQMQNSTDSCISGTTVATSTTNTTRPSDHRNSDTSVSSDGLIRSGSVVHGFSPVSTSFRAKAMQGMPMPHPSKLAPQTAKKTQMFQLGASSEDDESSFESKVHSFRPQRSSLSQSITKHQLQKGLQKKNTSFRDIVEQRRMDSDAGDDEGAIASSDEDDDESAIDDDDDDDEDEEEDEADWEDSPSDDEKAAAPEQYKFRRVESRPDLVSRPSMLSMQLEQNQRRAASTLQNVNSRSTPAFRRSQASLPNKPSMPGSPEDNDDEGGLMMRGTMSKPKPIIMTTTNGQQSMAHSPRTARRNMLSTELTESLRRNLLWERRQKAPTLDGARKRGRNDHSAEGATSPNHAPESNNQEFENPWEFNARGW